MRRALAIWLLCIGVTAQAGSVLVNAPWPVLQGYAAAPAESYWTDPNADSLAFNHDFQTTNATGFFLDATAWDYDALKAPTVAAGPAQVIVGTNSLGRVEYAASFDGANYASFTVREPSYTNLTFAVWVKSTVHTGDRRIFNDSLSYADLSWRLNAGQVEMYIDPNGGFWDPGCNVASNEWVHIAWTFDDTEDTQRLYTNGVLVGSDAAASAWANSAGGTPSIGSAGASLYFLGLIDAFRFYTVDLSGSESAGVTNPVIYTIMEKTRPWNNLEER